MNPQTNILFQGRLAGMSSHFDNRGHARMVDVSGKPSSVRTAVAESWITLEPSTLDMIDTGTAKKGDVLAIARLAAIQATKHTSLLIPLCHAIPVEAVDVQFRSVPPRQLQCVVTVKTTAKTGVEMEALTAASVAALTIYDMCKSVDRSMECGPCRLLEKSGGKSGDYRASPS